MGVTWEDRKSDYREAAEIIDAGLEKLDVYRQRAELVPAYVLAMSTWFSCSVLNV